MKFFERLNPLGPGKRSSESPENLPGDELTPEELIDLKRELTALNTKKDQAEKRGDRLSGVDPSRREYLIERLGVGDQYMTDKEEEGLERLEHYDKPEAQTKSGQSKEHALPDISKKMHEHTPPFKSVDSGGREPDKSLWSSSSRPDNSKRNMLRKGRDKRESIRRPEVSP